MSAFVKSPSKMGKVGVILLGHETYLKEKSRGTIACLEYTKEGKYSLVPGYDGAQFSMTEQGKAKAQGDT
jgi:hypothetical protein